MRCRFTHVPIVLAFALCIVPHDMRAQVSEIQPGARVRITAPGIVAGRYASTVLTRTADTIRVGGPDKSPLDIPISRITSLEVSRGDSRALGAGRGVLWGGGIGLAMGIILAAADESSSPDYNGLGAGATVAYTTLSGVIYGAVIGAIVGRERWESFDIPVRTSFRVHPGRLGAAFGFTY